MVIFTYLFVGIGFYISFPLPKWCIEDVSAVKNSTLVNDTSNDIVVLATYYPALQNLFKNFGITYTPVVIGRALLLFQLFTVFPLIMYILRVQLLILIKRPETIINIIGANAFVCTLCIIFALFCPNIGIIIRYSGALCGFIMIFTLPVVLQLKDLEMDGRLQWKQKIFGGILILIGLVNLIAQFLF